MFAGFKTTRCPACGRKFRQIIGGVIFDFNPLCPACRIKHFNPK